MSEAKPKPPLDRRLVTILLIVFVQMLGASMVLPIFPLFAKREFDLNPALITPLISVFFLAQFIAGPFLGGASDRYGRLPILIISQIGTVISFAMLGLATNVETLFLARILDGITGGNIIVAQAYVTDITPRERRTQSLGLIFAGVGLGFIFGPALGGILAAAFGERIPFLFASIAAALVVLLTWFTLDESLSKETRQTQQLEGNPSLTPRMVFGNQALVMVLVVVFFSQFAFGLLQSTFALYGEAVLFVGESESTINLGIGLILSVVGIGQVFTQVFLLDRLVQRFSDGFLTFYGTIIRGVSMFLFAVTVSPYIGGVSAFLLAIGAGTVLPASQNLATQAVDDKFRGGALGWYQSSRSLSVVFSTALGGILFEISPTTPYWIGGALFVVALIPAYVLFRWVSTHSSTTPVTAASD